MSPNIKDFCKKNLLSVSSSLFVIVIVAFNYQKKKYQLLRNTFPVGSPVNLILRHEKYEKVEHAKFLLLEFVIFPFKNYLRI